ncbi:MAG TPA: patatin family protein [Thermoleophilaceae bacterium]
MAHPVVEALHDPPPGARIALVVEGGGMRGAVSGGMALALDELGLRDAFDAAYGSSAGTLNAMWLVSGRVREGIPTWTDPALVHELISRRRLLRGGPVVDITNLVEQRYEELAPGLFDDVLAATTELHPIATEVETADPIDLHDQITDERTLRLALRATACLPLLAGPPVNLNGRRFIDAGLSAAIPFRAAIEGNATHILVLRSRRHGERVGPSTGLGAKLTARALQRVSPALERAFATRAEREHADEDFLDQHDGEPALLAIHPAPGSPVPSRLERDVGLVRAALEAGRQAAHEALAVG